jgi:hypothetical protein
MIILALGLLAASPLLFTLSLCISAAQEANYDDS